MSQQAVHRAIAAGYRFDVVIIDLIWDYFGQQDEFNGLDVLAAVRRKDSQIPVIFAAQGNAAERDFVDEAVDKPRVAGIYRTGMGQAQLGLAIEAARLRGKLPESEFPSGATDLPRIHDYFERSPTRTAAKMAAAIAAGNAVDHQTLARAVGVKLTTAKKVHTKYLGPLIRDRREFRAEMSITPEVVYRWCGEHARYILSWCRRDKMYYSETSWAAGSDSPV